MKWAEFARQQPRLAELGRERLIVPGVVLVGTTRADGTPRISPVEPYLFDQDFWLCMMWRSKKADDLARDPRVLVHNIVTSRDGGVEGEFIVRGTARPEHDPTRLRRFADAVAVELGWRPEVGRFHLFAVDVHSAAYLMYDDATGDQHAALWPQGREFVRRGTSATSVGDPEPEHRLLV
jgi:Pyridoxamine 5'-phosphate oxidase